MDEFEYVIEDVLDIKLSKRPGESRRWVSLLVDGNSGARCVSKVSGFMIGDTLLLVEKEAEDCPKRLAWFNRETSELFVLPFGNLSEAPSCA